ncbi:MAG: sensor domain-containing diguanylate cyclase [Candidatus Omnitrophica bacterium]|nr:sensor domain-containing diguanylate cyclase [Candidatus Omnitrophota bacterium]
MTQKLNLEYLKRFLPLVLFLFIPLISLFILAVTVDHRIFFLIGISLIILIIFLLPADFKINKLKSETELRLQDIREQMNLADFSLKKGGSTIRSFQNKISDFSELKGLTEKLSMCLSLEDTIHSLSHEVRKLLGDKDSTVILYLFHSKTGDLGILSSHKGQMRINLKAKHGDDFDHWIVKTMQPLLIEDLKSDFRFDIEKIKIEDERTIGSLMSVPMTIGRKALGILRIDSPQSQKFSTQDLRFLTTIGDLGAVAIENAQLYSQVQELAIKDGLTGLYLRRYFVERMSKEIARQLNNDGELSFMMIDIDHFKQYNDQFGHMAGDIVLKMVSGLMEDFFNEPGNLICRYGGEEFAIMLPDCPKKQACEMAQQLREIIEQRTVILRREKTNITVSIGVASLPRDAKVMDNLINKADQALYRAKTSGRNKVCPA